MRDVSKKSHCHKILPITKVTGVVKVSRVEEEDPYRETYWTETFDLSAHGMDGTKLFESFHVLAVPEDQFETFETLRRQVRQSLVSDFEEVIQKSCR